jgi:hypothetical protein
VPLAGEKFINADERVVGGRYFQSMEIPLRRGRFFNERDDTASPIAVIVDEYMADQLWPGQVLRRLRCSPVTFRRNAPLALTP